MKSDGHVDGEQMDGRKDRPSDTDAFLTDASKNCTQASSLAKELRHGK